MKAYLVKFAMLILLLMNIQSIAQKIHFSNEQISTVKEFKNENNQLVKHITNKTYDFISVYSVGDLLLEKVLDTKTIQGVEGALSHVVFNNSAEKSGYPYS